MIGSEAISFSGSEFSFVIQTLDDTAGEQAFSSKPIEQQRAVTPEHPCNPFHRFDFRTHSFFAPVVQKSPRPIGRFVRPEKLKLFFQEVASNCFEITLDKLGELAALLLVQIFRSFE